jgi:hypothetical protein
VRETSIPDLLVEVADRHTGNPLTGLGTWRDLSAACPPGCLA